MDIDLSQFRESFLAECAEHIGTLEQGLLAMQNGGADSEHLNLIFRAAHSIKGAAGTFGWTGVVRLTHAMEDLLDRLRSGKLGITPQMLQLLLEALDAVKAVTAEAAAGDGNDCAAMELSAMDKAVVARLRVLLEDGSSPAPGSPAGSTAESKVVEEEQEAEYKISFVPSPACFDKGINPLAAIEDLADQGTVVSSELDVDHLPALTSLNPMVCHLGWNLVYRTGIDEDELRAAFSLIDGDVEVRAVDGGGAKRTSHNSRVTNPSGNLETHLAGDVSTPVKIGSAPNNRGNSPAAASPTGTAEAQSIRVPAKKVDQLIDLAGELVIAYSMANDVLSGFTMDRLARLKEVIGAMERGTREIQERIMSVRMLPAGSVFQRFPRLAYDIAAKTGKQIAVKISGDDTELDKTIAEKLVDPLTHLVRNAADHGIENPEARLAASKPEQGTISLRAFHQAGKVVIEVADDGRGLDSERIRAKAVAKGLITEEAELPETEIQQLIFKPGFSTRDEVSDLSGRGVGMDVVKRNLEGINGTVSLESKLGEGTRIRLTLPLTLAIIDGLLLRAGEQSFALPLAAVLESLRPEPKQLVHLTGSGPSLILRSEALPLVRLARIFGIPAAKVDPKEGLVVVVEFGGGRLALMVDDVVGQQQFVVKSVEKNFRRVEGALGATILGNGTVALILDVAALQELDRKAGPERIAA